MLITKFRDAIAAGKIGATYDSDNSVTTSLEKLSFIELSGTKYSLEDTSEYVDAAGNPFTLKSLYFAYILQDKPFTEYFQECQRCGVRYVSAVMRKDVLDYLNGKTDENINVKAKIDVDLSPEILRVDSKDANFTTTEAIISKERVYDNSESIIVANVSKSFEGARKQAFDIIFRGKKKTVVETATLSKPTVNIGGPIIIVPAALTAVINMYNVDHFLTKSSFQHSDKIRKETPLKPSSITISHIVPLTGKKITFEVLESVRKPEDWDRVVAVFCSGQAWQFRGWKWEDPVELFSHIKGFYVKFSDMKMDPVVSGWNVSILEVNRLKRHLDAPCVHGFWNDLDRWLALNKQNFM